ncbi:MAG TPA: guanylate kinase [Candidatus Polarisedimenticolaceae bacterium]|nr:guanylate kinase [Candidatus Polarisedimenticolaceae bacterium]
MSPHRRGTLVVISAPSGTGKSTLARRLIESVPELAFSVSHTTRPRRAGEESGREYHFVDDARFDAMVAAGEFLEWAHVFAHRYGTAREGIAAALDAGTDVLLDIDVQGARQVRASGLGAVLVFVLPPDYDTLSDRLRRRGSEDSGALSLRLQEARGEAMQYDAFDYVVVNADLEEATAELAAIVRAERARTGRRREDVSRILSTFPAPLRGATE